MARKRPARPVLGDTTVKNRPVLHGDGIKLRGDVAKDRRGAVKDVAMRAEGAARSEDDVALG